MIAASFFNRIVREDNRVETNGRLCQFVLRQFMFNAVVVRCFMISDFANRVNIRFAYFTIHVFAIRIMSAMDSIKDLLGFDSRHPHAGTICASHEGRRGVSQVGLMLLRRVNGHVIRCTFFVFFQDGLFEGSQARFDSFIDVCRVPRFYFAR